MAALDGSSHRRVNAILQELETSHDMIDDDISYVDMNCTEFISCKRSKTFFRKTFTPSSETNRSGAGCTQYMPKPYGSTSTDPQKKSLSRQRIVYDIESEKTILPPQAVAELEKHQGEYCWLLWQQEWLPP